MERYMTKSPKSHSTLVITGGAGFIGRALVSRLLELGYHIRVIDRHPLTATHPHLSCHVGDFADASLLKEALSGADAVLHLASTTIPKTSNDDPQKDIATNLGGSLALLDAARDHGIRHFLYASSGGTIYGRPQRLPAQEDDPSFPLCSYGIVKLAFERYLAMYAALHGMRTLSLRLSNPFGPGQNPHGGLGAVVAFCHKAKHGQPIEIWGDGSIIRDYLYIDDAVDAFVKTLENPSATGVMNIGSGKGTSLLELISAIESQLGSSLSPVFKPGRNFDIPSIILDNRRAGLMLGWKPSTPLAEGIGKTIAAL